MVSLPKYGELFFPKKLSVGGMFGEIYGEGLLYVEELMIRSCQGSGSFINAFSNNMNTVNLSPAVVGYSLEN